MAIESHMDDPVLNGLAAMQGSLREESARRRAAMQQVTDNVMAGMQKRQAEQEQAAGMAISDAEREAASDQLYGPEGAAYMAERGQQNSAQAAGQSAYEASRMASGGPRKPDRDGVATMSEQELYDAQKPIGGPAGQAAPARLLEDGPPEDPTLGGTLMDPADEAFNAQVDAFADVHAAGAEPVDPEKAALMAAIGQGADATVAGIQNPQGGGAPMDPNKAALMAGIDQGADATVAGIQNPQPPRDPNRDAMLAQIASAMARRAPGNDAQLIDDAMAPYPVPRDPGLPGGMAPPATMSAADYARFRASGGR